MSENNEERMNFSNTENANERVHILNNDAESDSGSIVSIHESENALDFLGDQNNEFINEEIIDLEQLNSSNDHSNSITTHNGLNTGEVIPYKYQYLSDDEISDEVSDEIMSIVTRPLKRPPSTDSELETTAHKRAMLEEHSDEETTTPIMSTSSNLRESVITALTSNESSEIESALSSIESNLSSSEISSDSSDAFRFSPLPWFLQLDIFIVVGIRNGGTIPFPGFERTQKLAYTYDLLHEQLSESYHELYIMMLKLKEQQSESGELEHSTSSSEGDWEELVNSSFKVIREPVLRANSISTECSSDSSNHSYTSRPKRATSEEWSSEEGFEEYLTSSVFHHLTKDELIERADLPYNLSGFDEMRQVWAYRTLKFEHYTKESVQSYLSQIYMNMDHDGEYELSDKNLDELFDTANKNLYLVMRKGIRVLEYWATKEFLNDDVMLDYMYHLVSIAAVTIRLTLQVVEYPHFFPDINNNLKQLKWIYRESFVKFNNILYSTINLSSSFFEYIKTEQ